MYLNESLFTSPWWRANDEGCDCVHRIIVRARPTHTLSNMTFFFYFGTRNIDRFQVHSYLKRKLARSDQPRHSSRSGGGCCKMSMTMKHTQKPMKYTGAPWPRASFPARTGRPRSAWVPLREIGLIKISPRLRFVLAVQSTTLVFT